MNGTSSAREALIAEALGEIAAMLDRVEAVVQTLDRSRLGVVNAGAELTSQLDAFESRMAAITENAKTQVVKHVARRVDEIARDTAQAQTRAMEEAARTLFRAEVGPVLQRVAIPMQQLVELANRGAHPWQTWLTHAVTATVASGISWALAAWLWFG